MTGPAVALRIMVPDVWNDVTLEFSPEATVGEIKHRALTALHVARDPALYVMKYRGAAVTDDSRSINELGIVPNAHVIVLPRRRRPVR